jgi:hypothetical protein
MAVQTQRDNVNKPLIQSGSGLIKTGQTVSQDAGRVTGNMLVGTVMVYDPATAEWNSFTDETAIDGTAHPRGILMRELVEADIVAADVEDVPILVGGGVTIDVDQIVVENSKTLTTVVNVPTNLNASVEDLLRQTGIFTETTIDITETA